MWSDLIIEKMNLNNLWESHLKRNALATLAVTADKSILEKAGVIKIQGEKIIEYKEKPKRAESSIFFAGVFIAEPEIFEYPGKSLEKEVFPALVKKDLVFGYMDGAPYLHFHTKKEILRIKSQVQSLI